MKRLDRDFRPGLYGWTAVLLSSLTLPPLAFYASVQVSERASREALRESQQAWCPIVVTFDDAWRTNPPPTAAGKQIAAGMRVLRQRYQCDQPVR